MYTKTIKKSKSKSVDDQNRLVTKKLLMINFSFIICVTPIIVLESLHFYKQKSGEYKFEERERYTYLLEMLETLRAINSALNFFIYFFNGTRFRADTLDLLRIKSCRVLSK